MMRITVKLIFCSIALTGCVIQSAKPTSAIPLDARQKQDGTFNFKKDKTGNMLYIDTSHTQPIKFFNPKFDDSRHRQGRQ